MRIKTLVALVVTAAGLAVASGGAVAAQQPSFSTEVAFAGPLFGDPFNGVLFGRVASPKSACVPGRTVKLFEDGALLDTDRTSAKGAWAVFVSEVPDSSEARVVKRVLGKRGHRFVCQAGSLLID
ncbi:MAG: hypothetical protein EXQ70_02460 [Solirubrobacterales bacterium]|nr:hypothetical protein [Solirubrobacterales bacterium]